LCWECGINNFAKRNECWGCSRVPVSRHGPATAGKGPGGWGFQGGPKGGGGGSLPGQGAGVLKGKAKGGGGGTPQGPKGGAPKGGAQGKGVGQAWPHAPNPAGGAEAGEDWKPWGKTASLGPKQKPEGKGGGAKGGGGGKPPRTWAEEEEDMEEGFRIIDGKNQDEEENLVLAELRKRLGEARKLAKQVWKHQGASGGGKGKGNPKGKGKGAEEAWADHMGDEEDLEGEESDQDWAKPLTKEIEDSEEQIQQILKGKVERMPLKTQWEKKEGQLENMQWKIGKNRILLETKREQLAKATEAFREVEETLDRQSGKWEEWQEESRGLKFRMEEEDKRGKSDQAEREDGLKGELEELLEAAQKGDPKIMVDLLEQLRKVVAGSQQVPGGAGRRAARVKGKDEGAEGARDIPRRSRSPLRGRAWSK
jgi:hypothetical protein